MKLEKADVKKTSFNEDFTQITTKDSRFYEKGGIYYPSVTFVLGSYPKGKHFEKWLKDHGNAADHIARRAADEGTIVHNLSEDYLLGKQINFLDSKKQPKYSVKVWTMFLKFVDFWETIKPELMETEVFLYSDELRVAGTCDLVCKIDGEVWVIDLKTSNNLQTTYDLQTAIYTACFEERYGTKVDRMGVLWLKSKSRGPKDGKLQGKGWVVAESKRTQETNLEIFSHVRALFDLEHPNEKPYFATLPTSVKKS